MKTVVVIIKKASKFFGLRFILIMLLVNYLQNIYGQNVSISPTGNAPDNSAALDIRDYTDKGVLIPRLTTAQRNAIPSPALSLLIFNITTMCYEWWAGGSWIQMSCAGCTAPPSGVSAVATPNPVCAGNTLSLSGSATGATSWSWTGPNGFSSTLQNPSISNVTTANAGTYTLIASNACGSASVTTNVTVNPSCPKIYCIGGWNGSSALTTNEAYDPATNTWTTKAPMPTARYFLTSSTVNNVIYCIGGNSGSNYLNVNEAYDPATNTWTTKAPMPTARDALTSGAVNNIIYVIGGGIGYCSVFNTNEAYDPSTNTWSTKAPMPTARRALTSSVANNIIYCLGGNNCSTFYANNEAYDPISNSWTTKASMFAVSNGLTSSSVNNVIYRIGGWVSGGWSNINQAYDPITNSWTNKASMPTARSSMTSSVINNIIYCIGGNNGTQIATNEAYDPATNTWTTKAPMPTAREGLTSSVVP